MKQETIQEIKDTVNIVDIISEFVDLKPSGRNYKGYCPVHNESEPSFTVSPDKGICKCFGCGFSADSIGFLMEIENLSYIDSLKYIADFYQIEYEENEEYFKLYKINQKVVNYFHDHLLQAPKLIKYLKDRGLSIEIIKEFKLGYAPKNDYLSELNIDKKEANDLGLLYEDRPRFYNRIMFPIFNSKGKPIGFNSRRLPNKENGAKYLNISNTKIYNKSKSLYNLFRAKKNIKREDSACVVEGNMDVIKLYSLGIKTVVGTSGTAITKKQGKILTRYTDTVFLLLDSDEAGRAATIKAGFTFISLNLHIKVMELPEGKDPDDFFTSKNQFINYQKNKSIDFMKYFFSKQRMKNLQDKQAVIKELKQRFKNNNIQNELILNEISEQLGISKQSLQNELIVNSSKPSLDVNYRYKIEMTIIKYAIENLKKRKFVFNKMKPKMFRIKIARKILKNLHEYKGGDFYIFLDGNVDKKHIKFLKRNTSWEFEQCIRVLKEDFTNRMIEFLQKKLLKETNSEEKKKLLQKIVKLKKK
ncbi:MAG: DNA primase [Halanaerobiales bacterium]|nr:DNA primase [Halanaerobiales bacterium]